MNRFHEIEDGIFETMPSIPSNGGTPLTSKIRRVPNPNRFNLENAAAAVQSLPHGTHVEMDSEVTRKFEFSADVGVPFAQAVAGGALAWIPAIYLCHLIGIDVEWSIVTVWGGAAGWFLRQVAGISLIERVERLWGEREAERPLTIDARPEPKRDVTIRVDEKVENGSTHSYLDIPSSIAVKLPAIAHAVLVDGKALSRRGLSKVITEAEYKTFLDAMKKGRFVTVEKGKPVVLLAVGRAMLRNYIV